VRSLVGLAEMQRFRKQRLRILIPLPLQRLCPAQRESACIAMGLRIGASRQSTATEIPSQPNQNPAEQRSLGRDRPTQRRQSSVHRFLSQATVTAQSSYPLHLPCGGL
jgi:hypothetical protein